MDDDDDEDEDWEDAEVGKIFHTIESTVSF